MGVLNAVNEWFQSQCDGDWEHDYGITIETLDNPGWSVEIYLYETELQDSTLPLYLPENFNNPLSRSTNGTPTRIGSCAKWKIIFLREWVIPRSWNVS